MTGPRYLHACTTCQWLGQHAEYDLYACRVDTLPASIVLVARFSNDEHRYLTFTLRFYRGTPEELPGPFARAYRLARDKGLLLA